MLVLLIWESLMRSCRRIHFKVRSQVTLYSIRYVLMVVQSACCCIVTQNGWHLLMRTCWANKIVHNLVLLNDIISIYLFISYSHLSLYFPFPALNYWYMNSPFVVDWQHKNKLDTIMEEQSTTECGSQKLSRHQKQKFLDILKKINKPKWLKMADCGQNHYSCQSD